MESEYDVFISYRRHGGQYLANFIRSELEAKQYRVFIDVRQMPSGPFPYALAEIIKQSVDFVPILTSDCFAAKSSGVDHFLKEIQIAMDFGKNIVPVRSDDFSLPDIRENNQVV